MVKKYKGYSLDKGINYEKSIKRNKNINYLTLFIILINLYLLPKYLNAASLSRGPEEYTYQGMEENKSIEEDYNSQSESFIVEAMDIANGPYKQMIIDFQVTGDEIVTYYNDDENKIINEIDNLINEGSLLKVLDIEIMENSIIKVRMGKDHE